MKLLLITASAIVLSGCVAKPLTVCNEDIIYEGKLDTPVETCREDKPSIIAKVWNTIKHNDGNTPTVEMDPKDPTVETEEPKDDDEGNDTDDSDPSGDGPSDTDGSINETRVKGNNGFGNGDQSAPGGSLKNNNAENSNRGNKN